MICNREVIQSKVKSIYLYRRRRSLVSKDYKCPPLLKIYILMWGFFIPYSHKISFIHVKRHLNVSLCSLSSIQSQIFTVWYLRPTIGDRILQSFSLRKSPVHPVYFNISESFISLFTIWLPQLVRSETGQSNGKLQGTSSLFRRFVLYRKSREKRTPMGKL